MNKMDFYYYGLCHVCKEPSPDLKKCSSCKILHYCSKEHQLKDWPHHKSICKVITKTNKILVFPSDPAPADVNHYKYSSALLWRCEVGRPLENFEHQMWMFPKICAVCYSKEVNLVCQVCLSAAYCSEEHQAGQKDTHEKFCQSLKLCLFINKTLRNNFPSLDWVKYKINEEVQSLPETLEGVFNLMGFPPRSGYSKEHVDYIVMTEFFCPAINMIYALEKSGFIQNRQSRKPKLTIHLVGSDTAEYQLSWVFILEFFAHWINNLKSAKIFLIGPDVNGEEKVTCTFNCEDCERRKFMGTIVHVNSYYHDLVHFISKPDLVVAFNSGLHEFTNTDKDTWKESIPKLIKYKGIPTLLTAYTEMELQKDIARFPNANIKFVVEPQRNPYSNLRPIRNWEEGDDPVFYQNSYIAIVTKK